MIVSAYPSLLAFLDSIYAPRHYLSPTTQESYRRTLRHYGKYLGREPALTDLDEDRIAEFLHHHSACRQAWTVATARKHLLALANYAHRRGLIAVAPDVMPVPICRRLPEAYDRDHISRLVQAAGDVRRSFGGVPGSLLFQALFLVAYDTGARTGALWALKWTDYRQHIPALLFRAETQKQRQDQLLKISSQTAEILEQIRKPVRTPIFAVVGCRATQFNWVRRIFAAAGLPCSRRDRIQRIRRTTLTLMHNAGGDAAAQAGHSSDAITRRHYLDPSSQIQAADILPRPIVADVRQRRLF